MMIKTFKYRLYPNKTQRREMDRYRVMCCRLYNQLRLYLIEEYERGNTHGSATAKKTIVDKWRRQHEALHLLPSTVARDVAKRLHEAYQGFFRRLEAGDNPGFPKKRPPRYYRSFGVHQWGACKVAQKGRNGKVRICRRKDNIGEVSVRFHRPMKGEAKAWTVKKYPTGKWFIMFACEVGAQPERETGRMVGIDLGLTKFVTTSDGREYGSITSLRNNLAKQRELNKSLSRKKKGSNRYREVRGQLARVREKEKNQRHSIHHNVARELVRDYDHIAVEDLSVKDMQKNRFLSRSIQDAGWASFATILEQKAQEAGKSVFVVDPRNTSQLCSSCGVRVKKSLSDRTHECNNCGLTIDRDINAARNILQRSLKVAA